MINQPVNCLVWQVVHPTKLFQQWLTVGLISSWPKCERNAWWWQWWWPTPAKAAAATNGSSRWHHERWWLPLGVATLVGASLPFWEGVHIAYLKIIGFFPQQTAYAATTVRALIWSHCNMCDEGGKGACPLSPPSPPTTSLFLIMHFFFYDGVVFLPGCGEWGGGIYFCNMAWHASKQQQW